MKKKMKIMVALLADIILLGFVSVLLLNQWHSRYEQLDKTDRFILKEYNTYVEKAETEEIWKDFALEDKTILALKGKFGNAYLINPQNEVRSIFAKKIRMPSQDQIEVYRISAEKMGILIRMEKNTGFMVRKSILPGMIRHP